MSHPLSLSSIRELYEKARREAIENAGGDPASPHWAEKQISPYCGEWWRKWNGSKLDGHAACIVPEWFKTNLRAELAPRADITYMEVGKAIGVSLAVVRSWCSPIRR